MTTLTTTIDKQLEECAYDIELAQTSAVWQVIAIGKALTRARDLIREEGTRDFAEWAKARVGISKTGAYRAIQVFEKFGERPTLGRLEVSAAYALAMDGVPDEAIEQALEEAQSKPVTAKRAKEIVDEHRMEVVSPGGCSAEPEEPEPVGGTDAAVCVDEVQAPVPRQAKASGPQEPNDIGERRFAVRSVVEQQTDGQPAYVRLNIADLLEDLMNGLRGKS